MRMSDIMKELEAAMEKGDCKVKITIKRMKNKEFKIDISTEEDLADFDVDDTEGWSLERLQAKYDEFEDALEDLEDNMPSDEDEEAFDAWDEKCEELRDLMDELEDKMDEIAEADED